MTQQESVKWYKAAESIEEITQRGSRNIMEVVIASRHLLLVYTNDQLYCCTAKCPHAGGNLARGFTDAKNNIVCPLHKYRFQLSNGYNSSGEGYHLKTYRVMVNDDGVFVGISY